MLTYVPCWVFPLLSSPLRQLRGMGIILSNLQRRKQPQRGEVTYPKLLSCPGSGLASIFFPGAHSHSSLCPEMNWRKGLPS